MRIQLKKKLESCYLEKETNKRKGRKSNVLISKLLDHFCFWCTCRAECEPQATKERFVSKERG